MSRSWYSPLRLLMVAFALVSLCLVPIIAAATPCVLPDAGTGTVTLPPQGCGYLSPADVHVLINGLPPGDTLKIGIEHQKFFNVQNTPGGPLGGEHEQFNSILVMTISGTGTLSGFHRNLSMQAQCQTNTAPRTPGTPVQSFDTDMFGIQGQVTGDPDFDLLRITAGTGFNMPSPGHTTLTQLPGGNWNVDSFFDITYRIDFVGHPGTILGGHSGSTTGTIRMSSGQPASTQTCVATANAAGTVDLPPAGCGYVSPNDLHMMINGLPAGTTVHIAAKHDKFFNVQHNPDPTGGDNEQFGSSLTLSLQGTGSLASYSRTISLTTQCQSHVDAHQGGQNIQSFDTEMMGIQGQLASTGDPDFDLLRITAGSGFGLPSPGHTTLTGIPGSAMTKGGNQTESYGQYNVDSFFDITYRIDFIGHAGGPFGGMSGSTTGTIRMEAGSPTLVNVPGGTPSVAKVELRGSPNPFHQGVGMTLQYRLGIASDVQLVIFDAAGKRVRTLLDERVPAGPHAAMWDGRDDSGHRMSPGTYFAKLALDGKIIASQKATLIR